MASATILGTTGNQYIDSKIVWSSTTNTSANTSSVTAALYYRRNNTGYKTYGTGTFSITIGGIKTSVTNTLTITESAWVKAVEATETISHNSDGTKSITISASGSMSGTSLTSTSCSGTAKLDTIPRASSITSVSDRTLGKACAVKWTPLSTSFAYKLEFSLGDWSYTTGAISPKTTSAYTYTGYTLPLEVANQLPSSKTGTMSVTLYTYQSSSSKEHTGSPSTKTFTVTVPDSSETKPSLTMSLAPVSSLSSTFSSLYIQGKSKVKATFSAEGKYNAGISAYSLSVQGKSYGSPYQSAYLSASGAIDITGKATDTRGYSGTATKSITVIPYSKPKILPASGESGIICQRCDANGNPSESGTHLKIKARRSYSKVTSGGVQKNFCLIRYRYRTEASTTFSSWQTLLAKTTTSTDTVNTTLSGIVSSTDTAYVIQVGVADDIGETASVQFHIPTAFATIDIPEEQKGRRIGVGRYAENSDTPGVDMGMDVYFSDGKTIHGAFADVVTEIGVWNVDDSDPDKGYWRYRKWKSGAVDMNGLIKVTPATEGTLGTAGVYYSEVIYIDLPFEVVNFNFTGSSTSYHCFVGNCNSVDGNYKQIRLRFYRFTDFASLSGYNVYVRIVASGKLK